MAETRVSCRRSPSSDEMVVVFAVVFLVGSIASWFVLQDMDFNQVANSPEWFGVAIPIALVLVGGVCLMWAIANRIAGIMFEMDDDGLTDHRGDGRIPWVLIRSIDVELTTINRRVKRAKLVLYVGQQADDLHTVEVDLSGLDVEPQELVREAKLTWMKARARAEM